VTLTVPLDDERKRRSGGSDDLLGLFLLHPTDIMVIDGNEDVSSMQATISWTTAEHLHNNMHHGQ